MNRRGFLKLTGTAALALAGSRMMLDAFQYYDEADVPVSPYRDWIRDMGDYIQVLVPEGRTLHGERFDKPVLAGFAPSSAMTNCTINGPLNVWGEYFMLRHLAVDASRYVFGPGERRGAIKILAGTNRIRVADCYLELPQVFSGQSNVFVIGTDVRDLAIDASSCRG